MRIILKIIISFVILLLALYGLQFVYEFGLKHNQNLKMAYVANQPKQASVLIHGPCEAEWGVNPALIDNKTSGISSYNLALNHSDFADNFIHLYQYLKFNKAPNYLFLYVTPESFDTRYNTFNTYRFAPYLSDTVISKVVEENDPVYYQYVHFPFLKYAYYNSNLTFDMLQGYKHYFTNRKNAYNENGFQAPITMLWDNHNGKFAELYDQQTVFKWYAVREKYLRKTIQYAQSKGIKVILYESPVLKASIKFQINRNEMINKIIALAKSEQVEYVQFKNMPMEDSIQYYISPLNFNMAGVKLFNDTLRKYIANKCLMQN